MHDVSMSTLVNVAAMLKADIESTERELRKVQREIRGRGDDDIAENIRRMAREGGPRHVESDLQSDSDKDAARNPGVDTAAAVDRAQETGDQAAGVRRRHEADTKATSVLDGGES